MKPVLRIVTTAFAAGLVLAASGCNGHSNRGGGGGGGGGSGGGGGGAGTGEPPRVRSARYLDRDANGRLDAGDQVVVTFDRAVEVDGAMPDHFQLPVMGDTFGDGATVAGGPAADEVTIVLGQDPELRTRGAFAAQDLQPLAPSGLDVASDLQSGVIRAVGGGRTAVASQFRDLLPGFVAVPPFGGGGSGNARVDTQVVPADVDGDGDLDVLVVYGDGTPVFVWRNDGDGTFSDTMQRLGAGAISALAVGDIDGDGDVDLVTGSSAARGEPNRVWSNAGDGTFVETATFGVEGATAMALGDLDRDGDLDAVEGAAAGRPTRVWRNDGGAFVDTMQSLGSAATRALALADLDRDGDLDLVTGNTDSNRVWRNGGDGTFTDTQQTVGTGATRSVQATDLDRDGDTDLLVAGGDTSGLFRNDGNGGFASGPRLDPDDPSDAVAGAASGDLDGDGLPEVVVATLGEDSANVVHHVRVEPLRVALEPGALRLGSASMQQVVIADFDRDGDPDVLAASEAGALQLWRGSLSATRGEPRFLGGESIGTGGGVGNVLAAALADVDRDGDLDLLLGRDAPASNELWINDGAGRFIVQRQSFPTGRTNDVVFGDLDGDGDQDFVAGNSGTTTQVWLNDGLGAFTIGPALEAATTFALALGDLDRDGDLDLVRGNGSGEPSTVWLNDGRGTFTDSGQLLVTANDVRAVALGDLDGDGDLDVVLGAADGPDRIFANDGTGTLLASAQQRGTGGTRALALADLDGDGDLDLVSGKVGTPSLVFENLGAGEFLRLPQELGADVVALALADVDADGDLDMLAGAQSGGNVLWRNDGRAAFLPLEQQLPVGATGAAVFGDVNRDGAIDLVVGDATAAGQTKLFLQR